MVPVSFEFFPPKTDEQRTQLVNTVSALAGLQPDYVSVTFGAGGSTLDYTVEAVRMLREQFGLNAAPHLSCVGGTRAELQALLDTYRQLGCTRIVALRGDLPSGMATLGEFRHANDLVAFIREHTARHFHVEVACYPEVHPQANDARSDLKHFVNKVKAGADGAITQYFFNADAYLQFVNEVRKQGLQLPIVPGIMPISNFSQLRRFSEVCGAEIPRWIERRMSSMGDDVEAIRALGADIVAAMCRRLLGDGAPGLHFYTLNRSKATLEVLQRLGMVPANQGFPTIAT
jgi:methylenetetrahydrofolate reductase (NADPH)